MVNKQEICPKCGAKVNPGSNFCSECGTKLENTEEEVKKTNFDSNDELKEFYNIVGEDSFKPEFISMLSQKNLNESAGKKIKSNCINLINNNSFTYENIAVYDVISFKQYSYLLSVIGHEIIKNGKEFKKRDSYEYFGKKAEKRKIIETLNKEGKIVISPLINEFVECAVIDNEKHSFLPSFVIADGGRKYTKDEFIPLIKYVYAYENTYGVSPKFIFASNKKVKNVQLDTSFESNEDLNDIIFDKINLMIASYSIQVENALEELDKKVGHDAGRWIFQGFLKLNNLDKNPHGIAIKNRLEDSIYSLKLTSDEMEDKINEEIQIEVKNKKEKLNNKVYNQIGKEEVSDSFLKEIAPYNLDKDDAIKIRKDILNEIDEKNIKEKDYSSTFNNILDNYKIDRKHQILFEELNKELNSQNSLNKLKNHDLLDKKDNIRDKIHQDIFNNKLENEKDIPIYIDNYISFLEKQDVKKELNDLNDSSFDLLMKKFSVSSFIPLRKVKIEKLMDNVTIEAIKTELVNLGVSKYDHFNVEETINQDEVNQAVGDDDKIQNDIISEGNNPFTEDNTNETIGEDTQSDVSSDEDNQTSEEEFNEENEPNVEDNSTQEDSYQNDSTDDEPICPKCGFKNRSSVKFCTQCGTKLE